MSLIFKKSSIVFRYFLITFVLIVLPILVFFQLARSNIIKTSLSQKQVSDLVTLNTFATNVETYMDNVKTMGLIVAETNENKQFFINARNLAETQGKISYKQLNATESIPFAKPSESVIAISYMDPQGIFISEKTLTNNRLSYFFNKTLMDSIAKKNTPVWTKSFSIEFSDTNTVKKVFALVVPVFTDSMNSGTLLGYNVLFLDVERLNELLVPYKDDIYVLERENNIIASKKELPPHTNLFTQLRFSYALLLEDSSMIIGSQDTSLIVTTKRFAPLDLQLVLTSSYDQYIKEVTPNIPSLLTFVLYGMIFAFVSSLIIAKFQTKPILEMKNTMNKVKEGDLSVRLVPKYQNEFGELGSDLNSLLDRIQESMVEQKRQQQIQQKMELQILQEQVKPHFLYNVLEIISSMIRCGLNTEALATVEHLADFYRISLSHGSDIISIAQEMQLIESYLSLQKTRYVEFMDYVLAISPTIYKYAIPKLTLQPLVENAIYHGIKEKTSGGLLCVTGYLENQRVVFEVFDTGKGISPDRIKDIISLTKSDPSIHDTSPHFGVASIVRRLNILYNEEISFNIDSCENEYTCITISFPAIVYGKQED